MLSWARDLGDRLIVIVAHDEHNKKPGAVPAARRIAALRALGIADKVALGDPDGFAASVMRERPSVIALGYDQALPDEETRDLAKRLGIEVLRLPWMPGKEFPLP